MKEIKVKLTFTEEILGTAPSNPEIYKNYVASKAENAAKIEEEVAALGVDGVVDNARTVFSKNKEGELIMWDYQIKGFFKDAIGMLRMANGTKCCKLTAYKKKVDGLIFVSPRQIEFDNIIDVGDCQRPLRASTPQGERIAIAVSDTINAGATLTFTITLLNNELEGVVMECLDYGKLRGLGQWRNSGKGKFTYEVLERTVIGTDESESGETAESKKRSRKPKEETTKKTRKSKKVEPESETEAEE